MSNSQIRKFRPGESPERPISQEVFIGIIVAIAAESIFMAMVLAHDAARFGARRPTDVRTPFRVIPIKIIELRHQLPAADGTIRCIKGHVAFQRQPAAPSYLD
jgi:hypothetical protein